MTLRVVVVGPGAVGSFLGGTLGRGRPRGDAASAGEVRPTGRGELRLVEASRDARRAASRRRSPPTTPSPGVRSPPDLVLLAVKLFDLPDALAAAAAAGPTPRGSRSRTASARRRWPRRPARAPVLAGSLTTAVEPVDGGVRRLRTGGLGPGGRSRRGPGVARDARGGVHRRAACRRASTPTRSR